MKLILIASIAVMLCGCVYRTVEYDKVKYTHKSFMTQQAFGELEFSTTTNGATVKVKNFANDQVSAVREVKEVLQEMNKLKTPTP
jgi:hypothetical protein